MAIISISRMQQRRGLLEDLRGVNLTAGEFAWAMDHRRLFIGNGEVAEGAPRPGNTEVLTEHSPLLDKVLYRYLNRKFNPNTGTMEPAVNLAWQVPRMLQERLDDRISVRSFGVRGDGGQGTAQVEEETLNLRRAIYEVFLREDHQLPTLSGADPSGSFSGPWKALSLPAGVYVINRPLPLLRKMNLIGDGSGRTVVVLDELPKYPDLQPTSPNIVAGTASYRPTLGTDGMVIDPTDQTLLTDTFFDFDSPQTNEVLGTPVEDILISGITFVSLNPDGDIVRLRNCRDVTFNDCEFVGFDYSCLTDPYEGGLWHPEKDPDGSSMPPPLRPACVRIEGPLGPNSSLSERTQRLYFTGCRFANRVAGITANDDILQVSVRDSLFERLYDGVNLGEHPICFGLPMERPVNVPPTYAYGPQNVTVSNSTFHTIRRYSFSVFTPAGGNGTMSCRHDMVGIKLTAECEPDNLLLPCGTHDYECVFFWNDGSGFGATGNFVVADSFFRGDLKTELCSDGATWYNPLDAKYVPPGPDTGDNGFHSSPTRADLPRVYNGNNKNMLVLPGSIFIGNTGISVGGVTTSPMSMLGVPLEANSPGAVQSDGSVRPIRVPLDPENANSAVEFDIDDYNTALVEYSIAWNDLRRVGVIKLIVNSDSVPEGGVITEFDDAYHEPYGHLPITLGFVRGTGADADKIRLTFANTDSNANGTLFVSLRKWLTS